MITNKSIISKNLLFFFITFSMLGTTVGLSQNCSADLIVEKDRNTRSADENGTTFPLILTNTSSSTATYILSTVNLREPCTNKNSRTIAGNVDLNVVILEGTKGISNKNEIIIRSGQTHKFMIQVTVPKGTPYKRWSCIEVQAKSNSCNSISATTILKVFVPDPSEG